MQHVDRGEQLHCTTRSLNCREDQLAQLFIISLQFA
jgi:hypothetical protein